MITEEQHAGLTFTPARWDVIAFAEMFDARDFPYLAGHPVKVELVSEFQNQSDNQCALQNTDRNNVLN